MEKTNTASKIIEVKNGLVEIIYPEKMHNCAVDQSFYKFLAKLLIEDKKMQIKNESHPS